MGTCFYNYLMFFFQTRISFYIFKYISVHEHSGSCLFNNILFVCAHVYVHMYAWLQLCGEVSCQHWVSDSSAYILRQGLSLVLELTILIKFTGHWTPSSFLSLPHQGWNYNLMTPQLHLHGFKGLNSGLHASTVRILLAESSLQQLLN